jgi:hypothetical protein
VPRSRSYRVKLPTLRDDGTTLVAPTRLGLGAGAATMQAYPVAGKYRDPIGPESSRLDRERDEHDRMIRVGASAGSGLPRVRRHATPELTQHEPHSSCAYVDATVAIRRRPTVSSRSLRPGPTSADRPILSSLIHELRGRADGRGTDEFVVEPADGPVRYSNWFKRHFKSRSLCRVEWLRFCIGSLSNEDTRRSDWASL